MTVLGEEEEALSLRNCADCGVVFVFKGSNLCPACMEEIERDFDNVRSYLEKNPGAKLTAIAEGTGVSESRVLQFYREGRLVAREGLAFLYCERCGEAVAEGRICTKCRIELRDEIARFQRPVHRGPTGDGQMYTIDRIRGRRGGNDHAKRRS